MTTTTTDDLNAARNAYRAARAAYRVADARACRVDWDAPDLDAAARAADAAFDAAYNAYRDARDAYDAARAALNAATDRQETETMPKLKKIAAGHYTSTHYTIAQPEGQEFWQLRVRYSNGDEDWAQNYVTKRDAVEAAEWCWTNDRHDVDAKN